MLGVFEQGVLREYVDLRETERQRGEREREREREKHQHGKNYVIRCLVIRILHQIPVGLSDQRRCSMQEEMRRK
jgi:hypothetical protein